MNLRSTPIQRHVRSEISFSNRPSWLEFEAEMYIISQSENEKEAWRLLPNKRES
jgi:hypothetical protein